MTKTLPQYIGGERVSAPAPEKSTNPSNTNEVVAEVPKGGEAEVNAAVEAASQTNDEAAKKEAYATVQQHIVEDLPYIPIVVSGTETFFNTTKFTGWPTEDDMYMFPPSWQGPSSGVILGKLGGAQ